MHHWRDGSAKSLGVLETAGERQMRFFPVGSRETSGRNTTDPRSEPFVVA